MAQAVRRKGPRRTIPEDLPDPGLLWGGEHGGRYRSRTAPRGPVTVRVSSPSRAPQRDSPAASTHLGCRLVALQCTPLSQPTRWAKTVVDLFRTTKYSRTPCYFCAYQRGRHMTSP